MSTKDRLVVAWTRSGAPDDGRRMLDGLLSPLGWTGPLGHTDLGAPTSPWLRERGLSVSLSRTAGVAACAVGPGAVGVDVEAIDGAVDMVAIAEMQFDADAARAVAGATGAARTDRFFRLWTLKEAALKALGVGFATPAPLSLILEPVAVLASDPAGLVWQALEIDCGPAHRMMAVSLTPSKNEPRPMVEEII